SRRCRPTRLLAAADVLAWTPPRDIPSRADVFLTPHSTGHQLRGKDESWPTRPLRFDATPSSRVGMRIARLQWPDGCIDRGKLPTSAHDTARRTPRRTGPTARPAGTPAGRATARRRTGSSRTQSAGSSHRLPAGTRTPPAAAGGSPRPAAVRQDGHPPREP